MFVEFNKPIKMDAPSFFDKYPAGFYGRYTGPETQDPAIEVIGNFKDKVRIDPLPYINLDCQGNANGVRLTRLDFPSSQGVQVMSPKSTGLTVVSCRQPTINSITVVESLEDTGPAVLIRSESDDSGDSTNAFYIGTIFVGNNNNTVGLRIEGGGKATGLGACRNGRIGYYWFQSPWDRQLIFKPKSRTAIELEWCLDIAISSSLIMFDPTIDRHTIADIKTSKDCSITGTVRHPKRTVLPPIVQDAASQLCRNVVTMQLNPRDAR